MDSQQYTSNLLDCTDDMPSCCYGAFCTVCQIGEAVRARPRVNAPGGVENTPQKLKSKNTRLRLTPSYFRSPRPVTPPP